MTEARLRTGVLYVAAVAALLTAVLVGVNLGTAAAPRLDGHSKLFPLFALGAAGGLAFVVAAVTLEPAWILSFGLGLSIFSGNWSYMHVPGPLDRIVTAAGVVLVIVRPLFVRDAPRLRARRVYWALALLTLYAIGSAAWAGSLIQHESLFLLLDRLGIEPFLLFIVAPVAFATARHRRILLVTLAVVGAYLAVLAVFEEIGPHSLVFPSYINNTSLGLHSGRARGPFLEAGADGLALFTGAVACCMLLPEARTRRVKALLMVIVAGCALGLLLTETRQVWLGAAAGGIVAGVASPRLRRFVPLGVALAAVLLGAAYFGIPGLQAKLHSRTGDQRSLWDRYNSDSASLRMVESRPLLGFGWGQFADKSPRYYHVAHGYPLTDVLEVHNVTLSNAVELGIPATLLWLGIVAWIMLSPLSRRGPPDLEPWKYAGLAIAIAWFVQSNFAPVSYAFDNYIPYVFAAIAFGPVLAGRSRQLGSSAG